MSGRTKPGHGGRVTPRAWDVPPGAPSDARALSPEHLLSHQGAPGSAPRTCPPALPGLPAPLHRPSPYPPPTTCTQSCAGGACAQPGQSPKPVCPWRRSHHPPGSPTALFTGSFRSPNAPFPTIPGVPTRSLFDDPRSPHTPWFTGSAPQGSPHSRDSSGKLQAVGIDGVEQEG